MSNLKEVKFVICNSRKNQKMVQERLRKYITIIFNYLTIITIVAMHVH